jgi:hypothetical protein
MRNYLQIRILGLILACTMFMGNRSDKQLLITFHHFIENQQLVLHDTSTNIFGEMVVRKFKYYVSNLVIISDDGKRQIIPNSYFLIDEADSFSKTIALPYPNNTISSIEFMLGVDSLRNCSGIQTGTLDPMHGMFWTWNTGYIFAKLEGNSPVAKTAAHTFTYHIGGFKTGENAIKTIQLPILKTDFTKGIQIKVDLNAWFNGKETLLIANNPICHSPGKLALRYANNYAQMFSILQP